MKKISGKTKIIFFCLYPKVSCYSRKILSDVNGQKILVIPDNISRLAPKIINVGN